MRSPSARLSYRSSTAVSTNKRRRSWVTPAVKPSSDGCVRKLSGNKMSIYTALSKHGLFSHALQGILIIGTLVFSGASVGQQLTLARHLGIALPTGSKQLDENRFQSSRSYEDTKKEFRERLSKSDAIRIMGDEINLPHVRATFYKNSTKNAPFYGINIYLNVQTGLTEIFFLVDKAQEEKP